MENGKIKIWLPAVRAGSGSDIFTLRLAAALEKHGFRAHITWFSKLDELFPLRMMLAPSPTNVDVIVSNSWTSYAFGHNKRPMIAVVHHALFDPQLDEYKKPWQRIYHKYFAEPRERRSLGAADAIVAVSAYVAGHIKKRYGISASTVIHNWIDTEKFRSRGESGKTHRPFRLLFIGKPTPLKGAQLLSQIMRPLGPDFQLWITATKTECSKLHLPANTHYLGWLTEDALISTYLQCDALLCPSYSEGFGYAALEAMASGKPVIARAGSGVAEFVRHNVNGLLCPQEGAEGFIEACRKLASDPDYYQRLCRAARAHAVESCSEAAIAASYIHLIESYL